MNEGLIKYVKALKNPKALIVIGIIGILLIFLSSFSGENQENDDDLTCGVMSVEEYKISLEEDIKETVAEITGSKKVTVVVTLESGIRYSYADTREESETKSEDNEKMTSDNAYKDGYITVRTSDGGEQALIVTAEMPEVRGVAIVCEGGDNEYIFEKIQNAVTAALDITSKRVYICGRNT